MFENLAAFEPGHSLWMPPQASSVSLESDWLFYFILYVTYFFCALIFLLTVGFAWKYKNRGDINNKGTGPSHNLVLELGWSILPGIILMLIFVWGFRGYMNMAVMPPEYQTLEIQVNAYKWAWVFTYPNGYQDSQLHLPKGEPVRLIMSSQDVIHSLYMPAFRLKKDVVPGRYNRFWVEPTMASPLDTSKYTYEDPNSFDSESGDKKAGFDIFCAEYCGQSHSKMLSKVHVHPDRASYDAWLKKASNIYDLPQYKTDWVAIGDALSKQGGCRQCHSIDGSAGTGPTWKNLYNKQGQFTDGTAYIADDNYIHESILYSGKHIVAGFGNVMPVFLGKYTERDMSALIRYIKSNSDEFKAAEKLAELKKPDPALSPKDDKTPLPPAK